MGRARSARAAAFLDGFAVGGATLYLCSHDSGEGKMMNALSDLDLAALLCSRVCHDVISPVGAIANGLEMLAEETDEEMRTLAFDLVRRSADQASAKLQFCRVAFGAAGSAGSKLDLGEAGEIARKFVGEEKIRLEWAMPHETRDKVEVKLVLNLMLLAMSAIPRGGLVRVGEEAGRLAVRATGEKARLPEASARALAGEVGAAEIDARLVQVYYTTRLAAEAGYRLDTEADPDGVALVAMAAG
jgi:histidine phosphotransferase ChpT